jgi:hypothetical protein
MFRNSNSSLKSVAVHCITPSVVRVQLGTRQCDSVTQTCSSDVGRLKAHSHKCGWN